MKGGGERMVENGNRGEGKRRRGTREEDEKDEDG